MSGAGNRDMVAMLIPTNQLDVLAHAACSLLMFIVFCLFLFIFFLFFLGGEGGGRGVSFCFPLFDWFCFLSEIS